VLKDELKVIEKTRSCATSHASLAREFKSEDSWADLLIDTDIKLLAAVAE